METQSLINIKNAKEEFEKTLSNYKVELKEAGHTLNTEIGNENEYTISSLIGGITNLMVDLSYLLKASNIFLKVSTLNERNNIYNYLTSLDGYLTSFNFQNAIDTLDNLKVLIRNYHIRGDKKRFIEYSSAIDNLTRKAQKVDEILQDLKDFYKKSKKIVDESNAKSDQFNEKYESLITTYQKLEKDITDVKQTYSELSGLLTNSDSYSQQILQKLNSSKANEITIQTFAENVSNRENQLKEQQIKTDEYNKKLVEFEKEHKKSLDKSQELIESAREALKLSTAQGISAAFSAQYDIANNPLTKIGWLVGSVIFLIITIALGAWVVGGWFIDDPENIRNILGRIALLPLSLIGTLFCANQYVKQKNIAEDYAYKTVLAKSLVAFSDELNKRDSGEKYAEYLSTVLNEIHQDPLRKRGKEEKDFLSSLNVVKKAFDWFKQITSE